MFRIRQVKSQWAAVAILALAFVWLAPIAIAKTDEPVLVTANGKIKDVNLARNTFTVEGHRMILSEASIVVDDKGRPASLAAFKNGYSVGCRFWFDKGASSYVVERLILLSPYYSHKIPAR